jgi:hypothetical protein
MKAFVWITLVGGLMVGCTSIPTPVDEQNRLTHGAVQMHLEKGITTQNDVLTNFGAPNITTIPANRNPKLTASINPNFTPSINPKYTASINPKYTASINPKYTPSINPKYTPSINPKYTPSINPKYTPSINPKFTPFLDPTTSKWTGYYLFDLDMEFTGVVVKVKANKKVMQFFDTVGKWKGYFVSNDNKGYNWFDLEGTWIGFAISNSKNGFNIFDRKGKWIFYMN